MKHYRAKYNGYLSNEICDSEELDFSGYLEGAEWIVYSYMSGGYEGDGVSIHKKMDKYYLSNIGHCSCYSPQDQIENMNSYNTIEELLKNSSEGLNQELQQVINVIKEENL